jgi:hypothetical protein
MWGSNGGRTILRVKNVCSTRARTTASRVLPLADVEQDIAAAPGTLRIK